MTDTKDIEGQLPNIVLDVCPVKTLPISELEFPNVTVCPPRNSFTNLNPDIVRSREISLSEKQRQALSGQVSQVVYTSNMERKLATYKDSLEEDRYRNQYHGLSKIRLQLESGSGGTSRLTYKGERYFYPKLIFFFCDKDS